MSKKTGVSIEAAFSELVTLLRSKNFDEGVKKSNELLANLGDSHQLRVIRGDLYYSKGVYITALSEYRFSEKLAGVYSQETSFKIALTLYKLGDLNGCKKNIKEIALNNPDASTNLIKIFGAKIYQESIDKTIDKHQINKAEIFNPKLYKRLYFDLKELDDSACLKHFEDFGKKEGRIGTAFQLKDAVAKNLALAPEGFEIDTYIELNQDIKSIIAGLDYKDEISYKVLNHYLNYGKQEGRRYSFPNPLNQIIEKSNQIKLKLNYENQLELFLSSNRKFQFKCTKPDISIIVPVYGRFDLLLNLLFSLESQLDKNFELIIVDNNSPDIIKNDFYSRLDCKIIKNADNRHYLMGCNQGAEIAIGKYLLFSNSDMTYSSDVMSKVLVNMNADPKIGALGGKLIHQSTGLLQEVGAVIFADGSTRGVGRGYGKDAFWVGYKREVDYVSGCFLVTPKEIFKRVKGFTIQYSPAYYEDVDYCVKVNNSRLKVVVDPEIVLYHHEYASEKKKQNSIDLQINNRDIFVNRHHKYLSEKSAASDYHELKIDIIGNFNKYKSRILIIDDCIPLTSNGSGYGRAGDILNLFAKKENFITHVSTAIDLNVNSFNFAKNKDSTIEFIASCSHEEIKSILIKRLNFYDYVFVSRRHNMELFLKIFQPLNQNAKIIFDVEALFSVREFINSVGPSFEEINYAEYGNSDYFLEECKLLKFADYLTFASALELDIYQKYAKKEINSRNSYELGHSFTYESKTNPFSKRAGLIFMGAVSSESSPNADSIQILIDDILPRMRRVAVLKTVPFYIVGNIKSLTVDSSIKKYCKEDKHTIYMGEVDDVDEILKSARLFVAPSRIAAGIPHKLAQASKNGIPIITTALISQQLSKNVYAYTCNGYQEMIDGIERLYQSETLWKKYSALSLKYLKEECNHEKYERSYKKIVA